MWRGAQMVSPTYLRPPVRDCGGVSVLAARWWATPINDTIRPAAIDRSGMKNARVKQPNSPTTGTI